MDCIYEDMDVLPDIDVEYKKVQSLNKELITKITQLEAEVSKLTDTLAAMKKQQQDLENNISSLFNTARAECERKDRRIDELQKKFDDIVFKRDTYRHREMSDSSRHSSHSSRSTSPKDRKDRKDHRERKDLPSRSSNHHDRGNNNKHSKNYVNTDNRDTRDKYKGDKDKNNPKPVKRSRNDDRKSPPIKKPRYEPEKQKSEKTVKENERDNLRTKKNDSHEKNDKSKQKSKDKELNKDKTVKKKLKRLKKLKSLPIFNLVRLLRL
ncbi:splicing regulatory glutamine/lysine-rich protein 1-like [Atheta coriaria]|uniref:splicing regulatory glutamine/lysine-rich protein 1-like n=1 Tax=Dalotia coriaria TaxID=877792 RepID=UPI0031F3CA85